MAWVESLLEPSLVTVLPETSTGCWSFAPIYAEAQQAVGLDRIHWLHYIGAGTWAGSLTYLCQVTVDLSIVCQKQFAKVARNGTNMV
jgi:hypothetical protein